MWGFSPAENLLALRMDEQTPVVDSADALNILLIRPCDPRHIVKTIAERRRTSDRPMNIYILETPIEVLARHLLLLHVFVDYSVPIRQRAVLFLEIFGNALVQEKTSSFIDDAGRNLVELVCGEKYEGFMRDIVDLSHLKQRERGNLEMVFKSWNASMNFDVKTLRDYRLRHFYGDRYDCRQNVLDWDYQNRVKKVASIIHIEQYREWRMSGTAFEFSGSAYSAPNRTCATYLDCTMKKGRDKGMKKLVQGYWADILVGPHISFGVDCNQDEENAECLFQIVNKGTGTEQHRHNCVEVSMYNILGFMWELETNKAYRMAKKHDIFSGLGEEAKNDSIHTKSSKSCDINAEGKDVEQGNVIFQPNDGCKKQPVPERRDRINNSIHKNRKSNIKEALNGVRIIPIGGEDRENCTQMLLSKKKYKNMFDVVFVSQQGLDQVVGYQSFNEILRAKDATVSVETGRFVYPLYTDPQQKRMIQKIEKLAKDRGWKEYCDTKPGKILSNLKNKSRSKNEAHSLHFSLA